AGGAGAANTATRSPPGRSRRAAGTRSQCAANLPPCTARDPASSRRRGVQALAISALMLRSRATARRLEAWPHLKRVHARLRRAMAVLRDAGFARSSGRGPLRRCSHHARGAGIAAARLVVELVDFVEDLVAARLP